MSYTGRKRRAIMRRNYRKFMKPASKSRVRCHMRRMRKYHY